jgi:hypothetical protein
MQVIVKNALEEEKRVARYPKHPKSSPGIHSQPKIHKSNQQTPRQKDFMQLIYDHSLLNGKSEAGSSPSKTTKPKPTSVSWSSSSSSPDVDNKVTEKVFEKPLNVNIDSNNFYKSNDDYQTNFNDIKNFEKEIENTVTVTPLNVNDLRVENDPESFKRSIVHEKQYPLKSVHDIVPHPRGGPDSHDVFKFDFDDHLPTRPSFTFTELKSFPLPKTQEKFQFEGSRLDNLQNTITIPTIETNFIQSQRRKPGHNKKVKHNNIVWEKLAKRKKPLKPTKLSKKERRKPFFKRYHLPSTHPLRSILPKTARVVGIQSIKRNKAWLQGVNRHDRRHHIMTVEEFLKMYPNMKNIRGAIPVPVSEKKHIRMIELLASQSKDYSGKNNVGLNGNNNNFVESTFHPKRQISQNSVHLNPGLSTSYEKSELRVEPENKGTNLDDMLKELDKLIAERAEKRVIHFRPLKSETSSNTKFISPQENFILHDDPFRHDKEEENRNHNVVTIRPRGEGPSVRFTSTSKPSFSSLVSFGNHEERFSTIPSSPKTTSPTPFNDFELSPKLEFGFKPIKTSPSFSFSAPTLAPSVNNTNPFKTKPNSISFLSAKLKSSDPFQTMFDSVNGIIETNNVKFATRYPRLIPSVYVNNNKKQKNKNIFKNNFSSLSDNNIRVVNNNPLNIKSSLNSIHGDPFFFTTTTTSRPTLVFSSHNDVDSVSSFPTSGISSTLFDMRKFFFIPKKKSKSSSKTNLVTSSSFQKSGNNRRVWRKKPLRRTFFPRISL